MTRKVKRVPRKYSHTETGQQRAAERFRQMQEGWPDHIKGVANRERYIAKALAGRRYEDVKFKAK